MFKRRETNDEEGLEHLRKEYEILSKNIIYTFCDFENDYFAKRIFDQLELPIYDHHLPSLILIDFLKHDHQDHLSSEHVKVYHYPATEPYGPRSSHLVITNPQIITNFVLDFFRGNLHPTLINEDIQGSTFIDYPQQEQMFKDMMIKKINAKTFIEMAKLPLNRKNQQIIMTCALFWQPCIDKLNQINQYLEERNYVNNEKKMLDGVEVFFFDLQHNNIYHRQFWQQLKFGYDIFGLFFKDPKSIKQWQLLE